MQLDPVTQKVVEKCISEVVREYTDETKYFTADTLHYLRTKITALVHERLGAEQVLNIDVGLDLTKIEDLNFFFKVNVPKEKAEQMLEQNKEK